MRYLVALLLLPLCLAAWARDVDQADRAMADGLYHALTQRIDGGTFEGTYSIIIVRDTLTPDEMKKGMQWLQKVGRENYQKLLIAEDEIYLRQHGVPDSIVGLDNPLVRERAEKRIAEYWETNARQWLILPKPWTRQYAFVAKLGHGNTQACYDMTLTSSTNSPPYFHVEKEREVFGAADNDHCTMHLALEKPLYHMTFGHARLAGVKYLIGLPDLIDAGLPRIEGLDAEDIRVLGDSDDRLLPAKRVLVDAGEQVMLLWVLPEKQYHIARCKSYRNGRLESVEEYGNWRKLKSDIWYPASQSKELVQNVEIRADLEQALKNQQITFTNLKLLEQQKPVRWIRYERIITKIGEEPAVIENEPPRLKGLPTEQVPGGFAPDPF